MTRLRLAVFDFDGTVVPSNEIKRKAYFETLDIDGEDKKLNDLINSECFDRTGIFASYLGLNFNDVTIDNLVEKYSQVVEKEISQMYCLPSTMRMIEVCQDKNIRVILSTNTPREPINRLLRKLNLSKLFSAVHSFPEKKFETIQKYLAGGYQKEEILVVGDGNDDKKSALQNDCFFIHAADKYCLRKFNKLLLE